MPSPPSSTSMLLTGGHRAVGQARRLVADLLNDAKLGVLIDDTELVTCELVTNALLHTPGPAHLTLLVDAPVVRVEVRDPSRAAPVRALASVESMTGRGLRLLDVIAVGWGVEQELGGKMVWAELKVGHAAGADTLTNEELLGLWDDDPGAYGDERIHVLLGDVPTSLLLQAKAHVDNLVREFTLAAAGARSGESGVLPPHLAHLIERVVNRFGEARVAIKRQALAAAARGEDRTTLELYLPRAAAESGPEYLAALDEVDAYARASRLLTLETPPQHRVFRHWYIQELVRQLENEGQQQAAMSFESTLLQEIGRVALAHRASARAARLFRVTSALSSALTPEAVAEAVLTEGVAALGASGGGLLLASATDVLTMPGTVGYDLDVVEQVRSESRETELPAALALRTGEPVWIESRYERDLLFPELATLERGTNALCAIPLETGSARLGALRFSFAEPRLFDDDERTFILALAAQTAQALDRAQLYQQRADIAQALQSALLPPSLPVVDGVKLAVMYQPARETMMVGGDFYDVWRAGDGTVTFVVGDVCGTGARAAATTATVRHTLHALATTASEPVAILHQLNRALYADLLGPHDPEMFLTAVFGVLRSVDDRLELRLAGGGHPWPLLRRANGDVSEVTVNGSFLGALPEVEVGEVIVTLEAGDTLLIYTDGITEARGDDGEMYGTERLIDIVHRAPGDPDSVIDAVRQAVTVFGGGLTGDDIAMLAIGPT